MIAAILRAQLRSMRFGGRGTVFSIVTSLIWYGLWIGIAVIVGLSAATLPAEDLRDWLPIGFAVIFAYWQIVPVISASMGSALDLRKLRIYPIPTGKLFQVEVLLRLTTALELVLVITAGTWGLLVNPEAGGWAAAPGILGAVALFVIFNLLVSSGLRTMLERLFSRRKVREWMVFLIALVWVLPRFLVAAGLVPKTVGGFRAPFEWIGLPWGAAAQLVMRSSVFMAVACLCGWTLVAFWFGRTQFERGLRFDAVAAQATPAGPAPERSSMVERFYRFPGYLLRDPLAGIVEKELRSLARTPRFRTIFIMGFTFGLLVWFPVIFGHGTERNSSGSQYFLIIVCVYSLTLLGQVTYWNSFGFDRSAAAFYFAAPLPISTVILGKNLASLCFIYIEVIVLTGVTLLLRLSHGLGNAIEALIVMGICSLYMLALGNMSSVNYPRALNPERVSQGGAGGRSQALVFILYPVALLPVFLAYLARYSFNSQLAFIAGLIFAALLGAGLYQMAMESAVHTATARREEIVAELSKGSGPVVSE